MRVYLPRHVRPGKGVKFYITKDDLLVEHPGTKERDMIQSFYAGPATEEFLVMTPVPPAQKGQGVPASPKSTSKKPKASK